jgi:hypothetical protein
MPGLTGINLLNAKILKKIANNKKNYWKLVIINYFIKKIDNFFLIYRKFKLFFENSIQFINFYK